MGNLITDRVAFFLKDVPPFDLLTGSDLDQIAQQITVQYFEEDAFIIQEGEEQNAFIYVLQQGRINLLKSDGEKQKLVDQCEPGDVFGIRAILTNNPYSLSAQCKEESLVYAVPKEVFQKYLGQNQAFALFFAKGYAAGQVIVRKDEEAASLSLPAQELAHDYQYSKDVVSCHANETIKEAAIKMKARNVGSIIIIDSKNHPIGIITDTDLRNKVVAGEFQVSRKVSDIMAQPVHTLSPVASISEVIMEMVRSGVHHLIITEDGSIDSPVMGVVSDHDVVVSQQNHPASLIKEIKRSQEDDLWPAIRDKAEQMIATYLEQGLSVPLVASTITKINDALISKAIEKSLEEIPGAEGISFCWLNLGSEGREEQLLRTDQDNAIVFSDTGNNESTQKILLQVAEKVTGILEQCGFEKCPADIMASNPKYCQPLSKWKEYFTKWIATPDPVALMNATIFFDFRPGWGNFELAEQLTSHLNQEIQAHEIFLNFLAQNALQNPPPLSFFKNFLVEDSGDHKNEFDIKKRAMMPLSDAARLLTLQHGMTGVQNTSDRYDRLIKKEPKNESIYRAAASAYELFLKLRTLNGLRHKNSGRFLPIEEMSKYDKQMLKNAFLSIKEIQELIKVRFQQSYFS